MITTSILLSVAMLLAQTPSQRVTVRPDKPINCEDFQAHLDHAIIDWLNVKETYMIVITRLGTGERGRKLNRARQAYIQDYLTRKNVQYVFAEGDRVEGLGRLEVYVGGRLTMSIPTKRGATRLCWGGTGD